MKLLKKYQHDGPAAYESPEPSSTPADKGKVLPAKKGRPTPSRNQASAMRKAVVPPPPMTRHEASQRRKAAKPTSKAERHDLREKKRAERQLAQERMRNGEEQYLPITHRGPVRRFVRNYIDSRHAISNYLLPITMLSFLVTMMVSSRPQWQAYGNLLMVCVVVILGADAAIAGFLALRAARKALPKETIPTITIMLYGLMRSIQMPRMRTPLPQSIVDKKKAKQQQKP